MALFSADQLVELRHQIALILSIDPPTADDIAKAAAYVQHRTATKIIDGNLVDGDPLPLDNWIDIYVTNGAPVLPDIDKPDAVIAIVSQFLDKTLGQTGSNIKP